MKKNLFLFALIVATVLLAADVVTFDLNFSTSEVIEYGEYQTVNIDDCMNLGEEGKPILPWKSIELLLPEGQEVSDVIITEIQMAGLRDNIKLKPASKPVPISQKHLFNVNPEPDQSIYSSFANYPEENIIDINTNYLAGHGIASFLFCPITYIPAENRVETVTSVSFEVITQSITTNGVRRLKHNDEIINKLNTIVDNPEMISSYNYSTNLRTEEYDILLISSTDLLPEFQDYIDFKQSTGWIVKAITTDEIYENYTGVDDPEKIRNCIIDYYENYDLGYVILGGDTETNQSLIVVPHRAFDVLDDPTMPSDIYFACLDGDWDNNNNNHYGESGEIDPYAEVYVGRICVDSATEIQNFTNKLRNYQEFPVVEDIEKALMIGEVLNDDPWTYGGDYKDQIVAGGTYDGYTTTGISDNFDIETLYERDYTWPTSDLYNKFNTTGTHLLNHLGHSSPTYNMKMTNSDINATNIHNNGIDRGYVIGYSQGCYNGSFDNWHFSGYYTEDCFAEKITTFAYGEVASIANSRYGWYMPGGTNSSSQYYDRQFFSAIFGDDITRIGDVNHLSKEVDVSYIQSSEYFRWVYYETNLFGDPTMDIWTETPEDILPNFIAALPVGSSEIMVDAGFEGARVALMQDGEFLGRGVTDASNSILIQFENPITTVTPIDISIIGHNKNRYLGTIYVSADQPYIVHNGFDIEDADNGIPENAEDIELDMTFINLGQQDGTNLVATLVTEDEYVTITLAECNLGDIASSDSTLIYGAFSITIDDYVPDGHVAHFIMNVTGDNGDAGLSYFNLPISAPDLEAGAVEVLDYSGDNNHNLDPGETATFTFSVTNNGGALSTGLSTDITVDDDRITIAMSSVDIESIAAGATETVSYTVTASDELEEGVPVIFTFEVTSADIPEYGFVKNYPHVIGFIYESFESGDFSAYDWTMSGDSDWYIVSNESQDGSFSARSGSIGSNQRSTLSLELDVLIESEFSFFLKVSSENNYDYLTFSVDGTPVDSWAGELDWLQTSQTIASGHHVLSWTYEKDQYTSEGSDCAWIDYVVMPVISGIEPAQVTTDQTEFEYSITQPTPIQQTLTITNTGEADLHYEVMADFLDLRGHGGPDDFGYQWYDSNAFNGPQFNWIDRPADATELTFSSNDDAADPVSMQFDFSFYGDDYSNVIINPNGWIGFGMDNDSWENLNLPNPDSPTASICAFWDDLRPFDGVDGGGFVYYQSYADSFIVWFEDVEHYSGDYEGTYDFQIILKSNDDIIIQYNTMEGDIDSATIGIQNASGTDGLQVANNQNYVEDGLAIIFRKLESWIYINNGSGVLSMGESEDVLFVILPVGLEDGIHTCSLLIGSNDPVNPIYSIPVTLEIGDTDSEDNEIPSVTSLIGNYPNPFTTSGAGRGPATTIAFSLAKDDLDHAANLTIYNLKGQKVKDFDFAPNSLDQYNEVIWDGKDSNANAVSSGVYFYRLDTHKKQISSKMLLMK